MPAHLLGYARVSTTAQDPALQHDALTAAGCYRVWTDTASGARTIHPALDDVLERLGPGNDLVVWRLDRLARFLRHLLQLNGELTRRGMGFRPLTESIDTTTTATGRLVLHPFSALGGVRAGPATGAARQRGWLRLQPGADVGDAPVMTPAKLAAAPSLLAQEHSVAAAAVGVSRASLYRALNPAP